MVNKMLAVLDNGHISAHCFTYDLSQLHINFARSVLRANTWMRDRYAAIQNTKLTNFRRAYCVEAKAGSTIASCKG